MLLLTIPPHTRRTQDTAQEVHFAFSTGTVRNTETDLCHNSTSSYFADGERMSRKLTPAASSFIPHCCGLETPDLASVVSPWMAASTCIELGTKCTGPRQKCPTMSIALSMCSNTEAHHTYCQSRTEKQEAVFSMPRLFQIDVKPPSNQVDEGTATTWMPPSRTQCCAKDIKSLPYEDLQSLLDPYYLSHPDCGHPALAPTPQFPSPLQVTALPGNQG